MVDSDSFKDISVASIVANRSKMSVPGYVERHHCSKDCDQKHGPASEAVGRTPEYRCKDNLRSSPYTEKRNKEQSHFARLLLPQDTKQQLEGRVVHAANMAWHLAWATENAVAKLPTSASR